MGSWIEFLTISEVHINIVCPDVGSHSNDRYPRCDLADADSCGYSIQVRHNNVHKDKIERVWCGIHLVNGFESVSLQHVSITTKLGGVVGDIQLYPHRIGSFARTWNPRVHRSYRPQLAKCEVCAFPTRDP